MANYQRQGSSLPKDIVGSSGHQVNGSGMVDKVAEKAERISKVSSEKFEELSAKLPQIDRIASSLPSNGFLGLAFGSMILSLGMQIFFNKKEPANFVGLWVPTLLLFGLYGKVSRLEGKPRSI